MRHLHLLGRDSHAGTDHVQRVGDHGSRGAGQGAGDEARERRQCPAMRGGESKMSPIPAGMEFPALQLMAGGHGREFRQSSEELNGYLCVYLFIYSWPGSNSATVWMAPRWKHGQEISHFYTNYTNFVQLKASNYQVSSSLLACPPHGFLCLRASPQRFHLGALPSGFHLRALTSQIPSWRSPLTASPSQLPSWSFPSQIPSWSSPLTTSILELSPQLPSWSFPLTASPHSSPLTVPS